VTELNTDQGRIITIVDFSCTVTGFLCGYRYNYGSISQDLKRFHVSTDIVSLVVVGIVHMRRILLTHLVRAGVALCFISSGCGVDGLTRWEY
jgi:hypothetical protein